MESSGLAPATTIDSDVLLSLGLATNTSKYEYQGIEHFRSIQDKEYELFKTDTARSQYFTFHHLTKRLFDRDFYCAAGNHLDFDSYYPRLAMLLAKMPETETHAIASKDS